jgi:transposase-like protein
MDHNHQNNDTVRQRIHRGEEEIIAIIEEYEKSGYSQREFCEVSEINESTFSHWLKKHRPKEEEDEPAGFARIEVTSVLGNSKPPLFAEIGNIKIYKELPVEYLKALVS